MQANEKVGYSAPTLAFLVIGQLVNNDLWKTISQPFLHPAKVNISSVAQCPLDIVKEYLDLEWTFMGDISEVVQCMHMN